MRFLGHSLESPAIHSEIAYHPAQDNMFHISQGKRDLSEIEMNLYNEKTTSSQENAAFLPQVRALRMAVTQTRYALTHTRARTQQPEAAAAQDQCLRIIGMVTVRGKMGFGGLGLLISNSITLTLPWFSMYSVAVK